MSSDSPIPAPGADEERPDFLDGIVDGIEWFPVGDDSEDCQCARCGSSCVFVDCQQCDHGFVERDYGDDVVPDLYDVPCEWCSGKGGRLHCCSGRAWCEANPLPGREAIASTALTDDEARV